MAQQMLKEGIRQKTILEPYNKEAVTQMLEQVKLLNIGSSSMSQSEEGLFSSAIFHLPVEAIRIKVQREVAERHKRLLLAYHYNRLEVIAGLISICGFVPENIRGFLTSEEMEFCRNYSQATRSYLQDFGGLVNIHDLDEPPKELFIHVRVEKDCGTIHTVSGKINLAFGSQHYMRRQDALPFLKQGYLSQV